MADADRRRALSLSPEKGFLPSAASRSLARDRSRSRFRFFFFARNQASALQTLQTCPARAGERHRVRGVRSDRPGMVAVGSARATMKSPAMAASARAGRRLESGCGRKPGRHCPRGEGPMWSNRPSFRFAPVLKGRGRAPDRRPGGGRSTACEATGVPWTADQAWGLVVGVSIYLYLYL